jgi:uncharacterized protein YndB with AHSA1/START domain
VAGPIEIQVEKRFRHPRGRVFDAFLDPARVGLWLFHTPDGLMEQIDYDPVPGGAFLIVERRGETLARHLGRFVEIVRPERIVFDFRTDETEPPTRVTVAFVADGGGCTVILTHDLAAAWAEYADRTRHGWTTILNGLVQAMENGHG